MLAICIESKVRLFHESSSLLLLTVGVLIAVWEGSVTGNVAWITLCCIATVSNYYTLHAVHATAHNLLQRSTVKPTGCDLQRGSDHVRNSPLRRVNFTQDMLHQVHVFSTWLYQQFVHQWLSLMYTAYMVNQMLKVCICIIHRQAHMQACCKAMYTLPTQPCTQVGANCKGCCFTAHSALYMWPSIWLLIIRVAWESDYLVHTYFWL